MRINHFIINRYVVLMLIMICTSAFAYTARPTHKIADEGERVDLENLIPQQFNDWRIVNMSAQIVNPETAAALNKSTRKRFLVCTKMQKGKESCYQLPMVEIKVIA